MGIAKMKNAADLLIDVLVCLFSFLEAQTHKTCPFMLHRGALICIHYDEFEKSKKDSTFADHLRANLFSQLKLIQN